MSEHIVYFGYGSLVNAATLPDGVEALPVRVTGWRRAWMHAGPTSFGRRCTLTVVPDEASNLSGVVVREPVARRAALDAREAEYGPVPLDAGAVEWIGGDPGWPAPFLYRGRAAHARFGDEDYPILLSYVDCVLAGFRRVFGAEGAAEFMDTTRGWHVPVADDRAAPAYPRAVALSDDERAMNDRLLSLHGVMPRMLQPTPSTVSSMS